MYIALYRKYRPKLFKDVISQNHITTTLQNEIKLKKIAHAYLFAGPKGTGKTTCAKIFSKAINCTNSKDGEACCKCQTCKNIEKEAVVDITEIDGASNNSVNDVRNIRDEAGFVPTYCSFRVYIIDEAHMLSVSAFNALLKIMEEPPEYVVFILATTDVEKIPATVVSRCQRFDFNRIKIEDIKIKIKQICEKEKIKISNSSLEKIAVISQGSLRDSISILDRCSVLYSEINDENLNKALGILDDGYILKIHNSILKKDKKELIKTINEIYYLGKSLENLVLELIDFYKEMLYLNFFKDEAKNILKYYKYFEILENLECFCSEKLNLILEELLKCFEKIKTSSNKKLFLEVFLLKICQMNFNGEQNIENLKNSTKTEVILNNSLKKETKENNNRETKNFKEIKKFGENKNNFEKFIEIAKNNSVEIEEKDF